MSNIKVYVWSAVQRFGTQFVGLLGNVLIANQLTPDDYGLIAMLSIIIGFAWNLTESGFADGLIRKPNADDKDFGTIFTFTLAVAIILYGVIFLLAPYISSFFNRVELIEICRVLGVTIIIRTLTLIPIVKLRKELQFKTLAKINLTASIISVSISFAMALMGYGYWALVALTLSVGLVNLCMIFVMTKWRPTIFFGIQQFKELRAFSFHLMLSYFSNQLGKNLYAFLIGKFHPVYLLGLYNQAEKLKDAPILGVNGVVLTTTYPLIAKETNEVKRFRMYESVFNKLLFIHFVLCAFLIGGAYVIFDTVFNEKWMASVPLFRLMVLAFLFYPLRTLNLNIAKVYGLSKLYRNLTFLQNGILVLALILTIKTDIYTILIGQIVSQWLVVVITMLYCGAINEFRIFKQLKIVLIQIWLPFITMLLAWGSCYFVEQPLVALFVFSVTFLALFLSVNEITKPETYMNLKLKVMEVLKIKR